MQQKVIFITQVSNLTKQMEVRSKQEEIDLGDLLERRKNLLERITKCDELIAKTLKEANSATLTEIIGGRLPKEEISQPEQSLYELSSKYYMLLEDVIKDNQNVQNLLQKSYDEAKDNLNKIRAEKKHKNMFR